jgi:hypothetical protein
MRSRKLSAALRQNIPFESSLVPSSPLRLPSAPFEVGESTSKLTTLAITHYTAVVSTIIKLMTAVIAHSLVDVPSVGLVVALCSCSSWVSLW